MIGEQHLRPIEHGTEPLPYEQIPVFYEDSTSSWVPVLIRLMSEHTSNGVERMLALRAGSNGTSWSIDCVVLLYRR